MPKIAQIWPGRNCLSCNCCVSGPSDQWFGNLCWYVSAAVCIAIVSAFATPLVWSEVSPLLPLAFYISVGMTQLFLVLTSCMDPGIIPRRPFIQKLKRNLNSTQGQESQQLQKYYHSFLDISMPQQSIQPQQNNTLSQIYQSQSQRYCNTCHIYRPARASHCGVCNNCVLVFDHHCGFINNCIGMRNYRFFVSFLAGVFISIILFTVNMVVYGIVKSGTGVSTIIIIIICSIAVLCIGFPMIGFLGYHCFLILTGRTTRQQKKKLDNKKSKQQFVHQNLWFNSQKPIIDIFEQIPEQQFEQLKTKLQQMQSVNLARRQQMKKQYEQYRKKQHDKLIQNHSQSQNKIHESSS